MSGDQFFDLQRRRLLSELSLLHPYLDAATSQHLRDALAWDFEGPLHIPKAGRRSLLEGLERFMNIHLDGFGTFKSLEVLVSSLPRVRIVRKIVVFGRFLMKSDENGTKLAPNQPKVGKSINFHDTLTSLWSLDGFATLHRVTNSLFI